LIRISIASAKRLGYSIKGYVFLKDKKTPQLVIEKNKKTRTKRKRSKSVKLIKCGNVYKLNLKELQ
jgi:hypothetical protein